MDWQKTVKILFNRVLGKVTEENASPRPTLHQATEEVMRQWQEAYALWQMSTDADLIDAAIFRIHAAEKQYVYLLRQALQQQEYSTPARPVKTSSSANVPVPASAESGESLS